MTLVLVYNSEMKQNGTFHIDVETWIACILQISQVSCVAYGSYVLLREIDTVSVVDSWNMYMTTAIGFSGIYLVLFVFGDDALFVSDDPKVLESSLDSILFTMTYFSVATQTLTGPGDISTIGVSLQVVVVLQMMVGMLYSLFIISHTQELFDRNLYEVERALRERNYGCCGRCWLRVKRHPIVTRVRGFFRTYLIVISLIIWSCNITMLHMLEPDVFRNWKYRLGVVFVECVFQFLQIGTVVATSWKFVRHVDEITLSFMAQAFVAVCVTYSGLYNLFFALSPPNDASFSLPDYDFEQTSSIKVVWQLFYYSVCTMTSAGFGDVYPRKWFTQLLAATQMLLSTIFTIVVLGRGVSRLNERRLAERDRIEMYAGVGIKAPSPSYYYGTS